MALSACTATSDNDQRAAVTAASVVAGAQVRVDAAGFQPGAVTVEVGTAVELVNADRSGRSYRATDAAGDPVFDSGVQDPGDTFTYVPEEPGTVTVKDPSGSAGALVVTVRPER